MKISELNDWLSLIANLGVILGVIFLIQEIRYARNAVELETLNTVMLGYQTNNNAIVENPDTAQAVITGLYKPEELTDPQAAQFSMWVANFWTQAVTVRRLVLAGLADQNELDDVMRQFAGVLKTPGGQIWWEHSAANVEPAKSAIESYFPDSIPLPFIMN